MVLDARFRLFDGQAVKNTGVHHHAGVAVRKRLFFNVAALDDLDDRQIEFLRKFPVARVVRRHRHDRAGAVGNEHIVGDEDRDLRAGQRVDGFHAFEPHAGLILRDLGALEIGFFRGLGLIRTDLLQIGELVRPLLDERVLRGNNHVRGAVQRIGARRIDGERIARRRLEIDLGAFGAADPVFLLRFDALRVIDEVEIVDQPLRISRNLQHPLGFNLVDDLAAAALADAVDDLLVREHALAGGAPVDGHLLFVGEPFLEELEENPLRPLVVFRVGRADLAVPVKRDAERLDLLFKASDVLRRDLRRMDVVLDRVVLGRQAERVPADRIKDVIAF